MDNRHPHLPGETGEFPFPESYEFWCEVPNIDRGAIFGLYQRYGFGWRTRKKCATQSSRPDPRNGPVREIMKDGKLTDYGAERLGLKK